MASDSPASSDWSVVRDDGLPTLPEIPALSSAVQLPTFSGEQPGSTFVVHPFSATVTPTQGLDLASTAHCACARSSVHMLPLLP